MSYDTSYAVISYNLHQYSYVIQAFLKPTGCRTAGRSFQVELKAQRRKTRHHHIKCAIVAPNAPS